MSRFVKKNNDNRLYNLLTGKQVYFSSSFYNFPITQAQFDIISLQGAAAVCLFTLSHQTVNCVFCSKAEIEKEIIDLAEQIP